VDLKNDKRQNTQGELGSSSTGRGEAQETRRRETESFLAVNEDESRTNTDRMMEEICEWENLKQAMWRVKVNKGSPGIDGLTVDELPDYRNLLVIREQLLSGTYEPQPVKRVEIPKPDGGVRKLGIPTALDRFVQQMESIKRFIAKRLKLKVNETKSAVARPQVRKFLGFSFTNGPAIRRTITPKAVERFKERVRDITRQARSVSLDQTMAVLAPYMRGWRGYFGFCETPDLLIQLTRWVRLRLRDALWRHWKTQRRRRAMLIQLGVRGALAASTAASSRGPWHLAHSKALSVALSNAHFRSRGFPPLFEQC
jgi:Group II intron, maturase-specific domain